MITISQYKILRVRFSAMLVYLRNKKGVNQIDVARALGVSRKAVGNGENAKVIPSAYSAFQLAIYYHLPYELLCVIPPKAHKKIDINNPATYAFITLSEDRLQEYIDKCAEDREGAINVWL